MNESTSQGVARFDLEASALERSLFQAFESGLEKQGYKYLSVPSTVKRSTIEKQGVIPWSQSLHVTPTQALSGSAEQGILEHFENTFVEPNRYWAHNQCFRNESHHIGWLRLLEFKKTELFSFGYNDTWKQEFDYLLNTATEFLKAIGLQYRVVDKTYDDPGYHVQKWDVEIPTKFYGWMETHSCTYFGEEQTKRFGITGATHTVSNTGLASPRILVPFLESQ